MLPVFIGLWELVQLSWYSDSLRVGRSRDRILVGVRFSTPVQTGSEAHPASCTMDTGSFLGVKRPGRDVDHPPPSSAEVKKNVDLYLYSPFGPSWPVLGRKFFFSSGPRAYALDATAACRLIVLPLYYPSASRHSLFRHHSVSLSVQPD